MEASDKIGRKQQDANDIDIVVVEGHVVDVIPAEQEQIAAKQGNIAVDMTSTSFTAADRMSLSSQEEESTTDHDEQQLHREEEARENSDSENDDSDSSDENGIFDGSHNLAAGRSSSSEAGGPFYLPTVSDLLERLRDPNATDIPGSLISGLVVRKSLQGPRSMPAFEQSELDEIADAARQNRNIKHLRCLQFDCRYRSDVTGLWGALAELPCLHTVTVNFDNYADGRNETLDYAPLAALIRNKVSLRDICISHSGRIASWELPLANMDVLVNALATLSELRTARFIRLFPDQTMDSRLLRTLSSMTKLRELAILNCDCEVPPGYRHPTRRLNIHHLRRMRTLRVLHLQALHLNTRTLSAFIAANASLVDCKLIQNSYTMTGPWLGYLGTALTNHPTLTRLKIDLPVDVRSEERRLFCKTFAEGLASNTVMRSSSHASFGDEHEDLSLQLNAYLTNHLLQHISLSFFPETQLLSSHLETLAQIIQRNSSLQHIHLRGTGLSKGACALLRRGLASSESKLSCFTLIAEGDAPPTDFASIALAVMTNPSLKHVRLFHESESFLPCDEMIAVLRGLAGNKSLKSLYVTVSRCTCGIVTVMKEEERLAIFDAVSQIYGLTDLGMDCILVDPECKKVVDSVLKLNEAGRRYMVEKNTKEGCVKVLEKVIDDLDCLYTHIRENPATLCDLGDGECDRQDDDADTRQSMRQLSTLEDKGPSSGKRSRHGQPKDDMTYESDVSVKHPRLTAL